jgi:hypothetical protein
MLVPLSDYVAMIPTTRTVSPPGSNQQRLVLTDEVRHLLRLSLKLLQDLTANNQSLFSLNDGNILVDEDSGIPRFDGEFRTGYCSRLAKKNYRSLQMIFKITVFNGVVTSSLPPDFQELLSLMSKKGHNASYLIHRHCSLVRPIDKKELFLRLYDYWSNVMQKQSGQLYGWQYTYVMNKLVFGTDWVSLIQQNQYLDMFYKKGFYNLVGSHPGNEILRFKRNTYSHVLENSWNNSTKKLMYNPAELVEMMELALPLVLHSFQVALDYAGVLKDIDVEAFFR